uniref:Plastid light harvesting protein n=1 Tax=Leptocylindrus danicus TaxID=163516 RepID=A0A7S2PPT6_9STRA|mmetsp:Transcript_7501/g.11158  ORF Transcript_7501/g.11158 Transcript_7501/m.11158 type:complete len:237 (+) Transcript_7501:197-907(+)
MQFRQILASSSSTLLLASLIITNVNALAGPQMSQAVPFLARPKVLDQVDLAGDVGFDPLNLAGTVDNLMEMREAEIKHARLAMLAAAGWPISELLDNKIASALNLSSTLDAADRVPSLLNGGLDKISPLWWGFCVGLTAAIDLYGQKRARFVADYIPGDLGFDPFGLYPEEMDEEGRKRMQLAEVKHGRIAMLAVTGYAIQEAVLKEGVVDETPFFFAPFTQTLGNALEKFLQQSQ